MLSKPHYYIHYQLRNDTHNYECHYLFNLFPHNLKFWRLMFMLSKSKPWWFGLTFSNATQSHYGNYISITYRNMFCNILKYFLLIEYYFNILKGTPLGREWSSPCQRNKSKMSSKSFSITVFIKKLIKGRFLIEPPF